MKRVMEGVVGTGVALIVTGLALLASPVIAAVMAFNDWKRARR